MSGKKVKLLDFDWAIFHVVTYLCLKRDHDIVKRCIGIVTQGEV